MASIRQQIIEAMIVALAGQQITAEQDRDEPMGEDVDDLATIRWENETAQILAANRGVERELDVVLALHNRDTDVATRDALGSQATIAMQTDPTFGGLAIETGEESRQFELDSDGEQPVSIITINYRVRYRTVRANEEAQP